MKKLLSVLCTVLLAGVVTSAQQAGSSPAGTSEVEIGGKWTTEKAPNGRERQVYTGGKWITISYGRPLKRGRELFGTGDAYATKLNAGAPVWRAGANVSTRLNTEATLMFGDKKVPPGEYSLFIDVKGPNNWTLIVSSWPALQRFDQNDKTGLWGAYGYTPDKDVARVAMKVESIPFSVEQLTWAFLDMTADSGRVAIMWAKTMASAPFKAQLP
jgi:hypothetical protein